MIQLRGFFALLLLTSLKAHALVEIHPFPVQKHVLKNGITVLLREDPAVPLVSYQTWFRIGSRNEVDKKTGLAHLFEHMMFKGTDKYPKQEYDKLIQSRGGVNNAFTTRDFTGYYIDIPSDSLSLAIDLESDRLTNLKITKEALEIERRVVLEERRYRVENDPWGRFYEVVQKLTLKGTPYEWPVIGWKADIESLSLEDCQKFWKQFYHPKNAVIVVVGSFNSEKVLGLIKKAYESMVAPAEAVVTSATAPLKVEMADLKPYQFEGPVTDTTLGVFFSAPEAGSRDSYGLDLLGALLGEGSSARLYRDLVIDKAWATSVQASNQSMALTGQFAIMATLTPKTSMASVENSIRAQLKRLMQKPMSEQEFRKVQTLTLRSGIEGLKTLQGQARGLAINEILLNDYNRLFTDFKISQEFSPEELRQLATKYLDPKKMKIVRMLPEKKQQVKK